MADIKGKAKIEFKANDFIKYLLGQAAFNINQNILQNKSKIRDEIRIFVYESILAQATAKGLEDNSNLAYNLGIPIGEGKSRAQKIAAIVSKSTMVSFPRVRRVGYEIRGGVKIGIVLSSYADVLDLASGTVTTDKEQELPWLRWLLLEGGKIIIPQYYVKYTINENSRSTGAFMIENKNTVGWRISPEYIGTEDDNWFTKSFEGAGLTRFFTLLESIIAKYIDKTAVVN